jgi:hypothetical protein
LTGPSFRPQRSQRPALRDEDILHVADVVAATHEMTDGLRDVAELLTASRPG